MLQRMILNYHCRGICLIWLMIFGLSMSAQKWSEEVWLIGGKKTLSAPFKKWKPEFQFDGRRTILSSNNIEVAGIRFGAELARVNRFGLGIYSWSSPIQTKGVEFPVENVAESNYTFSYSSLYYERVLFFNRKWEASAAAHLGWGNISRSYRREGEVNFEALEDIPIQPFELSASGFYHLTWWLSAGGGLGLRVMRNAPDELSQSFNAPVYIAKVKLRIGRLVKRIFKPEVKDEY